MAAAVRADALSGAVVEARGRGQLHRAVVAAQAGGAVAPPVQAKPGVSAIVRAAAHCARAFATQGYNQDINTQE